jgi:hypothetical protein
LIEAPLGVVAFLIPGALEVEVGIDKDDFDSSLNFKSDLLLFCNFRFRPTDVPIVAEDDD